MDLQLDISFSAEDALLKKFEEIHDYIYSNDGLSAQQALEEFVKVLFIKIHDENNALRLFTISHEEREELKNGKKSETFLNRISQLFTKTQENYPDIFDKDDRIKISTDSLGFTVNKLQTISLTNSSQDAKGLAFQKFLTHREKDRNGQFFTPTPVIDFCVAMMQPRADEKIIDPSCGSGGFLLSALNYLKNNGATSDKKRIIEENLYGFDINKSVARIAKMKLLLEVNGDTNILCVNSLEDVGREKAGLPNFGDFDLVLANPPFGAKITNSAVLKKFDLGHKWIKTDNGYCKTHTLYSAQNTEILFIERCLQLLREGGRMAIVLPNGNFENPSLEYLRHYIKLKTKILAVVNLPQETFIPYGTGVKTSILFLEKDTTDATKQYPVFFGRVTKLGYQGNKNATPLYRKDKYGRTLRDENGNALQDEDFGAIAEMYKNFKAGEKIEDKNAFSIDYNELNGRFDFDFYSPDNRRLFSVLNMGKTLKLGDVCEIVKSKSKKLKDPDLLVEYIELSDINTHSYEIINSTTYHVHELPSRASYELVEGDIITAIAGNSVGTRKHATAWVASEFAGGICTNGFRVLRNFKLDPFYLLYFLKTDLFLKQMFMYRTGAAIPNVSDDDLLNISVCRPSDEIMCEISEKMKRAFSLRQESRVQIESISFPSENTP
jgi:type I restriction enzyme M protein